MNLLPLIAIAVAIIFLLWDDNEPPTQGI